MRLLLGLLGLSPCLPCPLQSADRRRCCRPALCPLPCRYHKPGAGAVLEVPADAAAKVREAAKPFVEFLEQDTESDSDSEEE